MQFHHHNFIITRDLGYTHMNAIQMDRNTNTCVVYLYACVCICGYVCVCGLRALTPVITRLTRDVNMISTV